MIRICRTCKVEYEGDPGSTLCPSCVREGRKTTIRDRVCRTCGATFPGGPRAWYCPDCREERKQAQTRDYHRRKAAGKVRAIGSTDACEICGEAYTVTSGLQRYCQACAPAAWAEADRQQGRAWYAEHGDPDHRRKVRQSHAAELGCIICGKPFTPSSGSLTCSAECAAENRRRKQKIWEKENADALNTYQRDRYSKKLESMTTEERTAYREKVNAKARENYHKRKSKKED